MPEKDHAFDVFLCHASKDKTVVREFAARLRELGLHVWLDEWELRPGIPWQEELETAIQTVRAAAILYGPSGIGPWANREMRAFLSEFVDRKAPVIPVLLPGAPNEPQLPLFLKAFTSVDLRGGMTLSGLERVVWGVTGNVDCPSLHMLMLAQAKLGGGQGLDSAGGQGPRTSSQTIRSRRRE